MGLWRSRAMLGVAFKWGLEVRGQTWLQMSLASTWAPEEGSF